MKTSKENFKIVKSDQEWQEILSPEQFDVLRKHGTEMAGTSPLNQQYKAGIYVCGACGHSLFTSDTKYNSGTGWPSFYNSIKGAIATSIDQSLFMTRMEVHCSRCGSHLGHVFSDGPDPTKQRYCINGISLKFFPKEDS
jgi:peptide-methionine (R)-S-oxide reductase